MLAALAAHPLHTTLTQLDFTAADRSVRLTVRGFSDDLHAALGGDLTDSAAARYLPLAWCGLQRSDGVVWLCLRGVAPADARGVKVRIGVLFELYADQINIVQTSRDGRRGGALLFTRGDPPRPVP